jgi:hypothetical protein
MATLTDEQIDYVVADLHAHGIRLEGLRDNLLDHICILLEEKLDAGGNFEAEYAGVITTFYRTALCELEEEALFLASLRGPHVLLSRRLFFLGVLTLVLSPYLVYIATWWWVLRPAGDGRQLLDVLDFVLVFSLFPLLITLVIFLTPDRFDPLIPWRSKILLGFRPLIRVLPEPAG